VVEPQRLRFDFTHGSAVPDDTLAEIEAEVNHAILSGSHVAIEVRLCSARASSRKGDNWMTDVFWDRL
jgi:alanyl-tRNA synthetase